MANHYKIAPTEKEVAYYRGFSDIPHSRFISEKFRCKEAAIEIFGSEEEVQNASWLAPMFEARTKSISAQIRKSGLPNVLELGSGLSLRPYLMTRDNPNMVYVETNLLEYQVADKKRILKEIAQLDDVSLSPNLFLERADALRLDDLVRASGHFDGEPFNLVHEGLLVYFSRQEKVIGAKCFREILSNGGRWITTDLLDKKTLDAITQTHPSVLPIFAKVAGITERGFRENAFEDEEEKMDFLSDVGFTVTKYPRFDGSFELTSMKYVIPSAMPIAETFNRSKIYVMTPK